MRILTTALVLTAAIATTPALAAKTTSSSWEGATAEMQKQGPYSNVYGPDRSGTYVITNGRHHHHPRFHRAYRGAWYYLVR
jgi:hypothetical protein